MVSLCLNGFNGSVWFGGRVDMEGWIDATAAAGISLFAPDRFSLDAWRRDGRTLESLAHRMRDAGVECGFIGAAALLGGEGDTAADITHALKAAEVLGAGFIQVNVAAPQGAARFAALEEVCAVTRGSGIRIAIEYLPNMPLATLSETLDLVAHVGTDAAGAMIDIWHHEHGLDSWDALEQVPLDAIAYLEFCDAMPPLEDDLAAEMMNRRTFPGEGILDVARFASLFRAKGYDAMVSIEVLNEEWRGRSIGDFAVRARDSARRYWE